jgi:hypothetical protein
MYVTSAGMGKYNLEKDTWRRSVAGMYERNDQLVALTWDADVSIHDVPVVNRRIFHV